MDKMQGYALKSGVIKYDAKHDSYFIQSGPLAYSLHTIGTDFEPMLGETVDFIYNSAREVFAIQMPEES